MALAGFSDIAGRLAELWAMAIPSMASDQHNELIATTALQGAPVVWLLGKVQSGKTSIVRAITGDDEAAVGVGFKPCTQTARIYDFPAQAPLLRFLDTRGFGEVGYDPAEDMAAAMARSQLILVAVRALDQNLGELVAVLSMVRAVHPDWPVVVAQTCLHEAYRPGDTHVLPYPFAAERDDRASGRWPALVRSLARQRDMLGCIPGSGPLRFVPIDFTKEGDGLEPRDYGLESLLEAIGEAAPEGLSATLRLLHARGLDRIAQQASPHILSYARIAAAVDAVPVAGAIAVPGVQAKLLHTLAGLYGVAWDARTLREFAACLGGGIAARLLASFGIRQIAKLVPGYGQTAGAAVAAASSYATTYALGKAAVLFLSRRKSGEHDPAAVASAYRFALKSALSVSALQETQSPVSQDGRTNVP